MKPHPTLTTLAIALLSALAGMPSQAQSGAPTRAEVKAEAVRAAKAGEIASGEQGPKVAPFKPGQTRAERKAGTRDAVARREVAAGGEAAPPEAQARVAKGSGRPRTEVKAETRAANRAGALRIGESYPEKTR